MTSPIKAPFNPNDFVIGMIRTGVQVLAGWLLTYLLSTPFAEVGILIRDSNILEPALFLIFTIVYRQSVILLAQKYPVAEWLNGFPSRPNYIQPPAESTN